MKCSKCGGIFAVKSAYTRKNGFRTRNRVCRTCGYTVKTIEVPLESFERNNKLFLGLQDLLSELVPDE